MAIFYDDNGKKIKTVHFGAGMSDLLFIKIKKEKNVI
jgi:hypothetical protein